MSEKNQKLRELSMEELHKRVNDAPGRAYEFAFPASYR